MKTISEILQTGTAYLEKYGIDDPRLNMQILLCSVLKMQKIDLYLNFDKPLNEEELTLTRNSIVKLRKHCPIQYVVGNTVFYDSTFKLNQDVLIPRPETEELVDKIVKSKQMSDFSGKILDIGTGSGCIAVSLAKAFKNSSVYAIDVDDDILALAKENAERNHADNINYLKMDILRSLPAEKFDLIVSNPPYIPLNDYGGLEKKVKDFEPRTALTDEADGLTFYRRFAEVFRSMLNSGGSFYLEVGYGEAESIKSFFSPNEFSVEVSKDINGVGRFIFGKKN